VKPWRWILGSLVLIGLALAADIAGASAREEPPLVKVERAAFADWAAAWPGSAHSAIQ